ncbi:MAG: hypothetical protein V4465_01995 [Patescibacteria group bacterium]
MPNKTSFPLKSMLAVLILAGGLAWYVSSQDNTASLGDIASSTPITSTTTPIDVLPGSGASAPRPYGQVKLRLGETARFANLSVTPTSLIEDSRCPANVQCIQAGTVRVKVALVSGMGTSTPTIKLGEFATTEAETIKLVSVDPVKTTGGIDSGDYVFTFDVEKTKTSPVASGGCYVGGCSSEVCSDQPNMVSNCLYTESYACYKTATCERQATGQCGWTNTPTLAMCLANAR